jgi:hypothetical protein
MNIIHGLTQRQVRFRAMLTVIGVAVALMALMAYWLLRPYDYLVITPPITVVGEPVVAQGGTIQFSRPSVCIHEDVSVQVERWAVLISGEGEFELPDIRFSSDDAVCISPYLTKVTIPTYISPGEYKIRSISRYQANPIRTVEVIAYTPPFAVVPDQDTSRGVPLI